MLKDKDSTVQSLEERLHHTEARLAAVEKEARRSESEFARAREEEVSILLVPVSITFFLLVHQCLW